MANTLQSLFPFSTVPPDTTQVTPCSVEFSAPIIAGHYEFNDQKTPPQRFETLMQGKIGVIAGVMIGANCSPDDFAQNVEAPLKLQVFNGTNKTPVSLSPFMFSQFAHGDNYCTWWKITGSSGARYDGDCFLSVSGRVKQIPGMTSNELVLKISFNFWRVDKDFFKEPAEWRSLLERAKLGPANLGRV